ncbi:MAG TPA: cation:proton antiporter, partial [Chloroflexota bacterium]|nr:cation:proton antiporter [Chloroflexota bacterium]
GNPAEVLAGLALAAFKVVVVLFAVYFVGTRFVPWLLERAALPRTRELFILGVVSLALGAALLTQLAGLSLAFGAFLAGLVVAESTYRAQVLAEILPLRDVFVALFFVSVGMLINPSTLVTEAGLIVPIVLVVLVGKSLIGTFVVLLLGLPTRAAILTGLSLAQVGEFSFVLARIGVVDGVIPARLFDLILATALVTIVLTPTLPRAEPLLQWLITRLPGFRKHAAQPDLEPAVAEGLRDHAIIAGYGRVGQELAGALQRRGQRFVVVEYNPAIVRELQAQKVPVIYGDAASAVVLEHAGLGTARLLAILVPDVASAELTTQVAHRLYDRLAIVARVSRVTDVERLREAGASEVVQPEFEAGIEVIRRVLVRYGVASEAMEEEVSVRRQIFYQQETTG